jgi:hypothetical protein
MAATRQVAIEERTRWLIDRLLQVAMQAATNEGIFEPYPEVVMGLMSRESLKTRAQLPEIQDRDRGFRSSWNVIFDRFGRD